MRLITAAGFLLLSFCPLFAEDHSSGPTPAPAAASLAAPDFQEVYELLRANLAGANETDLNRAAVQGLLSQLASRANLAGQIEPTRGTVAADATLRTGIFDGAYGYLRIGQVSSGTDRQVSKAYEQLSVSNHLKGVVLDLRFAGGQDYAAAAALGDLFFSAEKPLLDWGDGLKKSTSKTNALALPLTILVNKQTTGAAEAFAGILRQGNIGLLLGTNTAGKATIGSEFTLKNGQHLWIATSLVKLGNGELFPAGGLAPDIQVEVSPEDEQAYFEDAYKLLPKANHLANSATNQTNLSVTNRLPRHRTTEAELVKMHRDGELPDPDAAPLKIRDNEPPPHVVYDPALARAIDLLKGLSVVQHFRAS